MRRKLGLPVPIVVLLVALAVPRVVTHDLGLFPEGSPVNPLLVFALGPVGLAVLVGQREQPGRVVRQHALEVLAPVPEALHPNYLLKIA